MIDQLTNRPFVVRDDESTGPYLTVEEGQLAEVEARLNTSGIAYFAEPLAISVDRRAHTTTVYFGKSANARHIESVLNAS